MTSTIERFRDYRSTHFSFLGTFFLRRGLSANRMTFLGSLFGIGAVYFLFQNYFLFLLFALFHLLADGLDGIIARVSKPTRFGLYFDYLSDGLIAVLILIKIGWFISDYYAYIVAALAVLAQVIHVQSKMKAPVLFTRTLTLVLVALYLPALIPITTYILPLTYLTTGVASLYSLARQLQWYISKRV